MLSSPSTLFLPSSRAKYNTAELIECIIKVEFAEGKEHCFMDYETTATVFFMLACMAGTPVVFYLLCSGMGGTLQSCAFIRIQRNFCPFPQTGGQWALYGNLNGERVCLQSR